MNKFLISFFFCYSYAITVLGLFIESSKDLNQCSLYNDNNIKKSINFELFFLLAIFFLIFSLFGLPFIYQREVSIWYYTIIFSSFTSCIFSIFNFLMIFNKIYDISKCSNQIKVINILLCFYIFISQIFVILFILYCIFLSFAKIFSLIYKKINISKSTVLSYYNYDNYDKKDDIGNSNL